MGLRPHRVHPLRPADLSGLPLTCPDCDRITPPDAAWAIRTTAEWGQCGWLLADPEDERDGSTANLDPRSSRAAVLVAAARHRPVAGPLAATPVSPDAAVLVSLRIPPAYRGGGIGRRLIQASAALAARRGCKGLEAVGTRGADSCCQLDVDWLVSVGFQLTRDHPLTPRLRMDLATTLTWRADLEAAWQRLTGFVVPAPPPEPVGRVVRH